jgi:hypothetical protein
LLLAPPPIRIREIEDASDEQDLHEPNATEESTAHTAHTAKEHTTEQPAQQEAADAPHQAAHPAGALWGGLLES